MSNKNVTAAAGTSSGAARHLTLAGSLGPAAPQRGRHPTAQTPEEMEREALGTIIGACRDIERCAEQMDVAGLKTHFGFLKTTIGRLDVIMTTVQQKPIEL